MGTLRWDLSGQDEFCLGICLGLRIYLDGNRSVWTFLQKQIIPAWELPARTGWIVFDPVGMDELRSENLFCDELCLENLFLRPPRPELDELCLKSYQLKRMGSVLEFRLKVLSRIPGELRLTSC